MGDLEFPVVLGKIGQSAELPSPYLIGAGVQWLMQEIYAPLKAEFCNSLRSCFVTSNRSNYSYPQAVALLSLGSSGLLVSLDQFTNLPQFYLKPFMLDIPNLQTTLGPFLGDYLAVEVPQRKGERKDEEKREREKRQGKREKERD